MTGQFRIGDLSFTFEGTLKELAHCQEIMREMRKAEYRLQQASGADTVYLIHDRDLEGDRGTFDKLRLRAYDDDHSYTLDIGSTDNNPLGVYVGSQQNVQVYDYEQKAVVGEITPDGARVSADGRGGAQEQSRSPEQGQGKSGGEASERQEREQEASGGLSTTREDKELVAEAELKIERGNGTQAIGGPRAQVLSETMERSGLANQDEHAVLDEFGVESLPDLQFAQVKDVYRFIRDLTQIGDDLPV